MSTGSRAPRPTKVERTPELKLVVTWAFSGGMSVEHVINQCQEWADGLLRVPGPEPVLVEAIYADRRLPLKKWARS